MERDYAAYKEMSKSNHGAPLLKTALQCYSECKVHTCLGSKPNLMYTYSGVMPADLHWVDIHSMTVLETTTPLFLMNISVLLKKTAFIQRIA